MLDEVLGQRIEQRRIGGQVRIAKIIDWIDNPLTHQVVPDAVGHRTSEEFVLWIGQPISQTNAAVFSRFQLAGRRSERNRRNVDRKSVV